MSLSLVVTPVQYYSKYRKKGFVYDGDKSTLKGQKLYVPRFNKNFDNAKSIYLVLYWHSLSRLGPQTRCTCQTGNFHVLARLGTCYGGNQFRCVSIYIIAPRRCRHNQSIILTSADFKDQGYWPSTLLPDAPMLMVSA